jgi:dihydroorotase
VIRLISLTKMKRVRFNQVKSLGNTIGCTITVHHLQLTVDDWAGKPHNFCKPVAKFPHDRQALRDVILEGHPRFFLGTDSAPHPQNLKECAQGAAGVFTSPLTMSYLATILESFGALDKLHDFACVYGKRFYGVSEKQGCGREIKLLRASLTVPNNYEYGEDGDTEKGRVVPFLAGKLLNWKVSCE